MSFMDETDLLEPADEASDLAAVIAKLAEHGLIESDGDDWIVTEIGDAFLERLKTKPN